MIDLKDMPLSREAYEDGDRSKLLLVDPALFDPEKQLSPFQRTKRWRKFCRKAKRNRFTGLSSLSGSMSAIFSWNAQVALTGVVYSASTNASSINKRQSYGTAATNAQSGGCDEVFSFQQGVAADGSATIDLAAMTDLLQRASSAIVRIKGYMIRLLSATDDPTISPAPTSTSIGVVTNIGPATPNALDFQAGGSGGTVALTGTGAVTAVAVGVGGTGYQKSSFFLASPIQAGGSGCVFLCTTNASGVISAVTFITGAGGASYSAATVPLVAVGQYHVYTGGAHLYLDPAAAGFTSSIATQKNIKLVNTDTTHAVTFEIDVFGATS